MKCIGLITSPEFWGMKERPAKPKIYKRDGILVRHTGKKISAKAVRKATQ